VGGDIRSFRERGIAGYLETDSIHSYNFQVAFDIKRIGVPSFGEQIFRVRNIRDDNAEFKILTRKGCEFVRIRYFHQNYKNACVKISSLCS